MTNQPFYIRRLRGWYIKTVLPNGKRSQKKLGSTREEAFKAFAGEIRGDGSSPKFSVIASEYARALDARVKSGQITANWVDGAVKVLKRFGTDHPGIRVEAVIPFVVTSWVNKRDLAPDTIRTQVTYIQGCLNWAVEQKRIESNPIAKYRKPGKRSRSASVITQEMHDQLKAAADSRFRPLLEAAWETGCRPGELRSLRWEYVSPCSKIAELHQHKTAAKTGAPRVLYFGPNTTEWLQQHRQKTGFVFLNRFGRPYTKDSIRQRFGELRRKTGLVDVVAYSYRHSFAARAIKSGLDILTVAEMMGHSDTEMLVRHYAHLTEEKSHLLSAAERVNRQTSACLDGTRPHAGKPSSSAPKSKQKPKRR